MTNGSARGIFDRTSVAALALSAAASAGCAAAATAGAGEPAEGGTMSDARAAPDSAASESGQAEADGQAGADAGDLFGDGDAGVPVAAQVFANNGTKLFRVDVQTQKLALVGTLVGCSANVQDVALDDASNLYATDGAHIWQVDPTDAKCLRVVVSGTDLPVAMSFVPSGTFGTNSQAIIGYTKASEYVWVNMSTGAVTKIGALSGGYQLSGDFVSVDHGPTYASVYGNGCMDCLVEVDPMTGTITKSWGSLGFGNVDGLAFWGGTVYGFDGAGDVIAVAFNGGKMSAKALPINPHGYAFVGAGSSTAAPLGSAQ